MWLYRLAGMRIETYHRRAVEGLCLKLGDTVVDLGCGTGLNFRYLQTAVGADGRIVGDVGARHRPGLRRDHPASRGNTAIGYPVRKRRTQMAGALARMAGAIRRLAVSTEILPMR